LLMSLPLQHQCANVLAQQSSWHSVAKASTRSTGD
jgi:hypothetical protein